MDIDAFFVNPACFGSGPTNFLKGVIIKVLYYNPLDFLMNVYSGFLITHVQREQSPGLLLLRPYCCC